MAGYAYRAYFGAASLPPAAPGVVSDLAAALAFLCFFAFFLVGPPELASPLPDAPDVAAALSGLSPGARLALPPVDEPELMPAPLPPVPDEPDEAPVPLLPDEPDAAPLPLVPDEPDEVPPALGDALELPLAPDDLEVSELEEPVPDGDGLVDALSPAPVEVPAPAPTPAPCASTTEDADAIRTNDSDRIIVFNVMSSSLS